MIRFAAAPVLISILVATGCTHSASASLAGRTSPDTGEVAKVATVDWKAVDAAMGRTSVSQPGDVHRFNMPRSDLSVTVDGVTLKPAFALGSWVAFKPVSDGVIAMGDLVPRDSEVEPVRRMMTRSKLRQGCDKHST